MSLRNAVEEVVKDMEEDTSHFSSTLKPYIKLLRMALRASEGEVAPPTMQAFPFNDPGMASIHHREMIEKAKAEFAGKRQAIEDVNSVRQAEIVDGPGCDKAVATYLEVPNNITPGMKTSIDGNVYQYRKDGKLHYLHPVVVTV